MRSKNKFNPAFRRTLKVSERKKKELVGNAAQQRNWRGIAIALLVIVIVCALIVTAVIIATPSTEEHHLGEKFTLEDYLSGKYRPASFSAQWIPGKDVFLYTSSQNEIRLFNCSSNSSMAIMENSTYDDYSPTSYSLSPDEKYLLLKKMVKKTYRHSMVSEYYTYDIQVGNVEKITLNDPTITKFQYMTWAPQESALILVYMNDIYYKPNPKANAVRVTDTGVPDRIYNGVPDWIYEEEVLSTDHAMWWSPQGKHLLYATFNDTEVPIFSFPIYGPYSNAYTTEMAISYPKAGATNPTFKLTAYRISDSTTLPSFEPPSELANQDYLFTSVAWRNDDEVLISWMNRIQNRIIYTLCKVGETKCHLVLEQSSVTGWLDQTFFPMFTADGSKVFIILPKNEREDGIYKHIAMFEISESQGNFTFTKTWLTHGAWEVTSLAGFSEANSTLYFLSPQKNPTHMHLLNVSVITEKSKCMTCNEGKECHYNRASLSTTGAYYIDKCLGPGVPKYILKTQEGVEVNRLQNNTEFYKNYSTRAMPWIKYEQVELETGQKAWCKLLMPPVLKEEEILTYPLLMHVYGGPGSQMVTEQFSMDWATALASSRNVIVGLVDGRGTGGRGENYRHANYLRLGTNEVSDTIKAAEYFSKEHYVDANKVAIWGWSYGAYLTTMALGRPKNPFKCGIAVAPVTDWIYYDSIYTERYMKTPAENEENYRIANASKYVKNFDSSFLLIHGTGDDNVHFQQSAQLVRALTEENIYFRFEMYTDQHHGIDGGNSNRHVYTSMEDFLVECFTGVSEKFGDVELLNTNEDE